jgi:integrase
MIRTRKNSEGKTSYQAIVKVKGYPDKVQTFRTKREAENWEIKIKAAMKAGNYRDTKPAEDITLGHAIDRYLAEPLTKKRKNYKTEQGQLLWWKKELGNYALIRVTPDLLAKKRDELASTLTDKGKERTPATVNRYMATLSVLLTVIIEEWCWLSETPLKFVRKLKEPRGRIRFLSDEERKALMHECRVSKNPHLYLIFILAISTGARKTEILNLKWQDIDLDTGRAILHETKNGERRTLYLTGLALTELHKHALKYALKSEFVFPNDAGTKPIVFKEAWLNAVKKAGIADFKFHDCRHSAASYLAMQGASPSEIAEVLGHKTLSMVKRYAHLSECHTQKVVESMNQAIFG